MLVMVIVIRYLRCVVSCLVGGSGYGFGWFGFVGRDFRENICVNWSLRCLWIFFRICEDRCRRWVILRQNDEDDKQCLWMLPTWFFWWCRTMSLCYSLCWWYRAEDGNVAQLPDYFMINTLKIVEIGLCFRIGYLWRSIDDHQTLCG